MTKPSKEGEKIEEWLTDPWTVDIQEIWEQAAHNPDPDKRQEQIINAQHFVI
ncbi:hypothetical protein HU830_01630 [Lactobacillus sp. DCY120]|uniref:Uncharacterized protein n=1 Tax=Bombilactobacillus apium TaxID=2675299 RepID=A0A850R1K5_9LACO|nr:hypothetical protein [Bombilactobacillus apium]NVY95901.1 hypothetical protein [Bombilactobacillus apium]